MILYTIILKLNICFKIPRSRSSVYINKYIYIGAGIECSIRIQ